MIETRPDNSDGLQPEKSDGLTDALEDLATSAERTSAEQQELADSARAMSRQRQSGRSWAAILDSDTHSSVLTLLGSSLRRLGQTSSRFRNAIAAALSAEGLSTRQIAARLGVTHQRVSAMLSRSKT
jgi:DNA-binding NarL/FixJ family response regulator